jgi:hypothetical protein
MSPLFVPVAMPLESAFRGIVSVPAAALAPQLLSCSLCSRLCWSVMMAVSCAAALLVVAVWLATVLLGLKLGLMLLAGLLAGGLLEARCRGWGCTGLSTCCWLVPIQVDGWKGAAGDDFDR